MRKLILATLAALTIGTAAFAHPAEAQCWWNGYSWHCWRPHAGWYRHHYWGPRYGHYYWGPPGYYGSAYGPRYHSGWGY
jgi:hypothetical protein